ncbi:MAG: hypothetical protein ACRC33_24690 [Gemmataceae bacterium]
MPRRDPGSVWNLLADLWRELSWTMRLGGGGGMLAGLLLGVWLVSGVSWREARLFRPLFFWTFVGLMAAGSALGLALGALTEWLTGRPRR